MATPTTHPFLYVPRWVSIDVPNLPEQTKYILEERDRELEDYLGSLSGGGGTASALRRTTAETHDTSTGYNINFSTTDYLAGMTASSGTLVCATAGVWHLTTSWAINAEVGGGVAYAQLAGGSNGVTFTLYDASMYGVDVPINLSMDVELAVSDVVRAGPSWGGGEVGGTLAVAGTGVLRLSAHLVG